MKYVHQYYGPIPDKHELILGIFKEANYINIEECEIGEIVSVNHKADLGCLNEREIEVLKEVNMKFQSMTASQISDISHREEGYLQTKMHDLISFEYAKNLSIS